MAFDTRKGSSEARQPWCEPMLIEHGTIAQLTQAFVLKGRGVGDDTFNIAVSTIS